MKKTIVAGLFLAAVSLTGCSGSADSLVKDNIAAMNEMADGLESGDKAKVEAGKKKMEEASTKLKELKLSDEDMKKLLEKHKPELEKALQRWLKASMGSGMKDLGGMLGGGMPGMPNMPNIPMGPDAGKKK